MRDFMEAVRSRVVVFDGGMGATLEQFDLTSEDYGGLPGKCHEALILHRPDVIRGVPESMLEAGGAAVGTAHIPAPPPQPRRVGPPRSTVVNNTSGRPSAP